MIKINEYLGGSDHELAVPWGDEVRLVPHQDQRLRSSLLRLG